MRNFFISFLIILLLGCVPHSDNPLTDPNKEQIDPLVIGTWFWKDEKESGYIHIGLDDKSQLLSLIMLEFDKDGQLKVSEFSGHTSSLEGNSYFNLKWKRPVQDEITGYMFMKYIVKSKSLGIALMDNKIVEKAITDQDIRGKVKKLNWSSSVRITEGSKKLREFILQNDNELFPEKIYLQKLKLPNNNSAQAP